MAEIGGDQEFISDEVIVAMQEVIFILMLSYNTLRLLKHVSGYKNHQIQTLNTHQRKYRPIAFRLLMRV